MGSGDARRHVPALPPVGGNAAGAAYCHHYLVTENCCPVTSALALTWRLGYARRRMVTDVIHPSRRPPLSHRLSSSLAPTRERAYTRPRMGTDTIEPSRRLGVTHPTTRLPDYPTTRLPDYPTTRLPRAASRSADRAAADRSAPVLSAAPSTRVAHSRHASARPTANPVGRHVSARPTAGPVGRNLHQSTPACVATLAGQRMGPSVADQGGAN